MPCASENGPRPQRGRGVPRVLGSGVQVDEGAGRIPGDFGRDDVVALQVGYGNSGLRAPFGC